MKFTYVTAMLLRSLVNEYCAYCGGPLIMKKYFCKYFLGFDNNRFIMDQNNRENCLALADIAISMSHPARLRILELLSLKGEACFMNVYEELGLSAATVFQHLTVLRKAQIVAERGDAINKKIRYYYITDFGRFRLTMLRDFVNTIS